MSIKIVSTLTQEQHTDIREIIQSLPITLDVDFPYHDTDCLYFLAYAHAQMVSALALCKIANTDYECIAFTHASYQNQSYFNQLIDEALEYISDTDDAFRISFPVDTRYIPTLHCMKNMDAYITNTELSMSLSLIERLPNTEYGIYQFETDDDTNFTIYFGDIEIGSFSLSFHSMHHVYFHNFKIKKIFQNKKHGSQAFKYILDHLHHHGFENIKLQVASDNTPALSIYLHNGFSIDRKISYYEICVEYE